MTRESEEKNLIAGCGETGLGGPLFTDKFTTAEIVAKSPEFSVICAGDTLIEYTWLALGWLLALCELPQPASNPAKPIRISMDSRFIILAYRIVIQTGFELAARLTEGGLSARNLPVFWSTANWKILAAFESST